MLLLLGVVLTLLGLLALLHIIALSTTAAVILLIVGVALVAVHYRDHIRR